MLGKSRLNRVLFPSLFQPGGKQGIEKAMWKSTHTKEDIAMKEPRFFICKHCGNLIGKIEDSGVNVVCCGDEMTELIANTVDASREKHVPVIECKGGEVVVKVGSAAHPMVAEHYISWIYLLTKQGGQRKHLEIGADPSARFALVEGDEVVRAYAYCNLHGLWAADA